MEPRPELPLTLSVRSLERCWSQALELSTPKQAHRTWPEYAGDPLGFIVNVLGGLPWSKQREIARDIAEHSYVAIAACTGPGKTWLLARLVLWWICTRPESVVITSSAKFLQVKMQLWAEIRDAHETSMVKLPGAPGISEYRLGPKWFALGLTARIPEGIAGFHARASLDPSWLLTEDNPDGFEVSPEILERLAEIGSTAAPVFVLLDEASGIDDALWDAFDGLLTNPGSKMLASGNPTRLDGRFHAIFHPPRGVEWPWRTHHISAYDTPDAIIGRDSIRRQEQECGPEPEKHPRFQVRVLGQFPTSADDYLFPLSLLEFAAQGPSPAAPHGRHIGFDVARHGGDKCVAVLLDDGLVASVANWTVPRHDGANLVTTAKRLMRLLTGWKVDPRNVHIDCTGGWGWGVHDHCHSQGCLVDGVDFGAGALDDWRFVLGPAPQMRTRRQELHWILQRCLQERYVSIPDPKDPEHAMFGPLWSDLSQIIHDFKRREDLWVESKAEYKSRVGRSPDFADALLCALSRRDPSRVRVSSVAF